MQCERCGFTHVSPYYFRTSALCRECFAALPPEQQSEVVAKWPIEPWRDADAPPTIPEKAEFKYHRWRRIYQDVVFTLGAAFLIWAALSPRSTGSELSRIGVIVFTIGPLAWYYYLFLRSPYRLVLDGRSLTAFYRGGKVRSWRVDDLVRTRQPWAAAMTGADAFVDQHGRIQFLAWVPYLNDSKVLAQVVGKADAPGHSSS
jgi:hypothetical protein